MLSVSYKRNDSRAGVLVIMLVMIVLSGLPPRPSSAVGLEGVRLAQMKDGKILPEGTGQWKSPQPYRVIFELPQDWPPLVNRVVEARLEVQQWMEQLQTVRPFNQYSLTVAALDGDEPDQALPFRFEPEIDMRLARPFIAAGRLVFLVADPNARRFAVYFGPDGVDPGKADQVPLIGDGDKLRLRVTGPVNLPYQQTTPCVVDLDRDGRRDLVGADRYGAGALLAWFRNVGTDDQPLFTEREIYTMRTVDGQAISSNWFGWTPTPVVTDWNGDALPDILVGGYGSSIFYYQNIGLEGRPVWSSGKELIDGSHFPKGHGRGGLISLYPEVADWDGDGDKDLLVGHSITRGIYWLPNQKKDANGLPVLGEPEALSSGGNPIALLSADPSVGDWDGDGDLDLLTGQYYSVPERGLFNPGNVSGCYLYVNRGTRTNPLLGAPVQLRASSNGEVIGAGFHATARMVDWNKDGKMDVIVSGSDRTALYLNEGTSSSQRLVPGLIPFYGDPPVKGKYGFVYPACVDWDNDGVLDLITGDHEGMVLFFRGLGDLQFAEPIPLKSEGVVIDEYGESDHGENHCGYVKVVVADWNNDGYRDLILWTMNGEQGWLLGWDSDSWCLKYFPGTPNPMNFGPPREIQAAGRHIVAGWRSKPDVVDLDGDGLLDLVAIVGIGSHEGDTGTFKFFKNIGTLEDWKLAPGVTLMDEHGSPMASDKPGSGRRTALRLVDWDGDGDLDMFTSRDFNIAPAAVGVLYRENVGTTQKPLFSDPVSFDLINKTIGSWHENGIDVMDMDGDGLLDIIIGNGDSGHILFFRGSFLKAQSTVEPIMLEKYYRQEK